MPLVARSARLSQAVASASSRPLSVADVARRASPPGSYSAITDFLGHPTDPFYAGTTNAERSVPKTLSKDGRAMVPLPPVCCPSNRTKILNRLFFGLGWRLARLLGQKTEGLRAAQSCSLPRGATRSFVFLHGLGSVPRLLLPSFLLSNSRASFDFAIIPPLDLPALSTARSPCLLGDRPATPEPPIKALSPSCGEAPVGQRSSGQIAVFSSRVCYKQRLRMGGNEWLGVGFQVAGARYTSGVRSESFEKC